MEEASNKILPSRKPTEDTMRRFTPYNPPARAKTAVTTNTSTPSNKTQVLKSLLNTPLRPLSVDTAITQPKTELISPPVSAPPKLDPVSTTKIWPISHPVSVSLPFTTTTTSEEKQVLDEHTFTENFNFEDDMFLDY